MSIDWISGKFGVAGISAAAIAVASAPDGAAPPSGVAEVRAVERTRLRATTMAPAQMAVQLDMARLKRLQPASDEVAATPTALSADAAPAPAVAPAMTSSGIPAVIAPVTPEVMPAVPAATAVPATEQEEGLKEKSAAQEAPPAKVEIVDAFTAKTWYVPPPPPPPVKPEPPPKPTAPPLPFAYIGRFDDPESPAVVFLVWSDRLYTVSEGDSIDGTYRVERVEKGRVELTYLPLQQKQLLQTGEPG